MKMRGLKLRKIRVRGLMGFWRGSLAPLKGGGGSGDVCRVALLSKQAIVRMEGPDKKRRNAARSKK